MFTFREPHASPVIEERAGGVVEVVAFARDRGSVVKDILVVIAARKGEVLAY